MNLPNILEKNNQSTARKELGAFGEQLACDFIQRKGYEILSRNFLVRGGEIDIIARKDFDVIVIEVKTRTSSTYGYGEEAVDRVKQQRMRHALSHYKIPFSFQYIRFDIISVDIDRQNVNVKIRHLKNIILD